MGPHLSDEVLVRRAADGDRWAQEALFRRHVGSLLNTLRHVTRCESDADDILQDSFAESFQTLERLRDPSAYRGWLHRIALNRARKLLRRRRFLRFLGLASSIADESIRPFVSRDASPEAAAEIALLEAAMATLPECERIAWTLRHVRRESLDDIAQWLGCSLATAKRRIAAAQAALEEHLRGER